MVIFRVELPEVATDVGVNVALAPVGNPTTFKPTFPVNPPEDATVTVYVVPLPCLTLLELGLTDIEKSGLVTTKFTVVECVGPPLAPVIVSE